MPTCTTNPRPRGRMFRGPAPRLLLGALAVLCLMALGWPAAPRAQASPPGPDEALGLAQCLELARQNSSQVRSNPGLRDWEGEKLSAAQRRFLPRVDMDLYHQPKVDYFGRPVSDQDIFSSELKLTQPIYASGALTAAHDKAAQGVRKAELAGAKAGLESAMELAPAFYRLLTHRQVAALREELAPRAAELVESARQGVRLGVLRAEDLLSAEARSLELSYQAAESQSQAKAVAYQLKSLLGLAREQALRIKPQEPGYRPTQDADAMVERAMGQNASLRWAKAEDDYQSLGLEHALASQGPRFSLVGRYGLEGESFPGPDKFAGVMVQCDISFGDSSARAFYDLERQFENQTAFYFQRQDLYRKGLRLSFLDNTNPQVQEAEARYLRLKAREELRDARLRLRAEVLGLMEELKRQEDLLGLAAKQRDLHEERVAVARGKAQAGAATPAEVLEREMDLISSKARMAQARYERARVLTALCLLTGEDLNLKDVP